MLAGRKDAFDEAHIRSQLLPFLIEHGASAALDEPVLDYATRVIVSAASDDSNDDAFCAAADVLNAVTGTSVDSDALEGFFFRARKRFGRNSCAALRSTQEMEKPDAPPADLPPLDTSNLALGLNPNACEFKPKSTAKSGESLGGWKQMQQALEDVRTAESSPRSDGTEDGRCGAGFFAEGMSDNEILEMLIAEFPSFDEESLWSILDANDFDIAKCVDVLTQLELEEDSLCVNVPTAVAPALNDLNFPSLGEKGTSMQPTREGSAQQNHNFVGAAKQGAKVQRPQPKEPTKRNGPGCAPGSSKTPAAAVPWLETGEAVTNLYADSRVDAREHARLRNAYFQQATQAYVAGNGQLAKRLSAQGRWHNEQMKAAHAEASTNIYKQRNSQANALNKSGAKLIDLHGLHVAEALGILRGELNKIRTSHVSESVQIVVGTGHHTRGSRTPARLPAAVMDFLEGEGLVFRVPQPGLIDVTLS